MDAEDDGDGLFSGWDAHAGRYDPSSWQYEGMRVAAASGEREQPAHDPDHHGAMGAPLEGQRHSRVDLTLTDPRCVFQILKRHFARYTPETVEEVCGVPRALLEQVARTLADNSGRERTGAFCYAVGWTQQTVGVQYIRTAAILQLLLGNIGRPGGGILALRGHASIQGSTDIPTLFNLLPGYIPMPHAEAYAGLADFIDRNAAKSGAWGSMDAYTISLLKEWWGDAATAGDDYRFDYLPRISGDHSAVATAMAMLDGVCKGYFLIGENPVVGTGNGGQGGLPLLLRPPGPQGAGLDLGDPLVLLPGRDGGRVRAAGVRRPPGRQPLLRVFKPTSPMNLGSWLLAAISPTLLGAAVADRLGTAPRLARAAEGVAAVLGPGLATYTAVLLADTAVPVWHEAGRELPFVFAGSAAASAGAAACLLTPPEHAAPARRLAVGGAVAELAATAVMERRLGELAEPYRREPARRLVRLAKGLGLAGALVLGLAGRRRLPAAAGGALLLTASACQRQALVHAGRLSARDPKYVVKPQRERLRR